MIKLKNEREVLPIVRNPYTKWEEMTKVFLPIIATFVESGSSMDEYRGWAFSFKIFRKGCAEYQGALAQIDTSRVKGKESWFFYPSSIDRNECIWVYGDVLILTHLESWLWFG